MKELNGKKVMVTGASGLIGQAIIAYLLTECKGVKIVALARNPEKARAALKNLPQENIEYLICDVCDLKSENIGVDYVIHAASNTASRAFVESPVEVITQTFEGTKRALEFAKANGVKGFVYLSTMETYGNPTTDDKIDEKSPAYLDSTVARSCYPESKRLCECLCSSYYSEYGVPAKIIRLTQTFGEGVSYDDKRVFAEFSRCAIEGRDIILKTKGETKRNYLYVGDAVAAVLTVLLKGENGDAYNAADEDTYCSIYDMANMVAREFGNGKVKVVIDESANAEKLGYAPVLKMNLKCDKLKNLGWQPEVGLIETFKRTIEYMRKNGRNE